MYACTVPTTFGHIHLLHGLCTYTSPTVVSSQESTLRMSPTVAVQTGSYNQDTDPAGTCQLSVSICIVGICMYVSVQVKIILYAVFTFSLLIPEV